MKLVIKFGGAVLQDEQLILHWADKIRTLLEKNNQIIIVHGGGLFISRALDIYKIKFDFIDGVRKTAKHAVEITEMVLTAQVNKKIVQALQKNNIKTIGLSGRDASLIQARKQNQQLGYVGEITKINVAIIHLLLKQGYTPIISPIGFEENTFGALNINADHVAAKIAETFRAHHLIYLSDVNGVLDTKHNTIESLDSQMINQFIQSGIVKGGMIAKFNSIMEALQNGIEQVHIMNGHHVENIDCILRSERSSQHTTLHL